MGKIDKYYHKELDFVTMKLQEPKKNPSYLRQKKKKLAKIVN